MGGPQAAAVSDERGGACGGRGRATWGGGRGGDGQGAVVRRRWRVARHSDELEKTVEEEEEEEEEEERV